MEISPLDRRFYLAEPPETSVASFETPPNVEVRRRVQGSGAVAQNHNMNSWCHAVAAQPQTRSTTVSQVTVEHLCGKGIHFGDVREQCERAQACDVGTSAVCQVDGKSVQDLAVRCGHLQLSFPRIALWPCENRFTQPPNYRN